MNAQAGHILKQYQDYIKNNIKNRIATYDPLDLNTTYKDFIIRLHEDDFKIIAEVPDDWDMEVFFDRLIKDFMIESAYFVLEKKYILYRFMKELKFSNPNDLKLIEIVDYVNREIEKDGFSKLKKFKEECKFKTFLGIVVTTQLNNFWRDRYRTEKNIDKYKPELLEMFDGSEQSVLENLVEEDQENIKQMAEEFLPSILENLEDYEKLAIRMKYKEDMNVTLIAKTLRNSRYKTAQFIKNIEHKIKIEIFSKIKKRRLQ